MVLSIMCNLCKHNVVLDLKYESVSSVIEKETIITLMLTNTI